MGGDSMSCMGSTDPKQFATNGEAIFRTGRNKDEVVVQDLGKSAMNMMVHSCEMCHGADGAGMTHTPSIRFRDLADPNERAIPYTDDLLKRFLDEELKSDGTRARTGVAWSMSDRDKTDLIAFLKTL